MTRKDKYNHLLKIEGIECFCLASLICWEDNKGIEIEFPFNDETVSIVNAMSHRCLMNKSVRVCVAGRETAYSLGMIEARMALYGEIYLNIRFGGVRFRDFVDVATGE